MAERFKATVLKTVVRETLPWVRIPLPPLKMHAVTNKPYRCLLLPVNHRGQHIIPMIHPVKR